jgi:hypothetical protein
MIRCELVKVMDTQLLLDHRDLLHRVVESVLPEQAVFLSLEALTELGRPVEHPGAACPPQRAAVARPRR